MEAGQGACAPLPTPASLTLALATAFAFRRPVFVSRAVHPPYQDCYYQTDEPLYVRLVNFYHLPFLSTSLLYTFSYVLSIVFYVFFQ